MRMYVQEKLLGFLNDLEVEEFFNQIFISFVRPHTEKAGRERECKRLKIPKKTGRAPKNEKKTLKS